MQRKQAPRPARPAGRYWKGKAPKGVTDLPSDSDDDDDTQQRPQEYQDGDVPLDDIEQDDDDDDLTATAQATTKSAKGLSVTLKDVNISRDGTVTVAGRQESGRTELEVDEESDSSEEEDVDDDNEKPTSVPKPLAATEEAEDEACPWQKASSRYCDLTLSQSSEYETDSEEEEEEPAKPAFRPVFVPKRNRDTVAAAEAERQDTEAALQKKELEAEERRKQSHNLVADSIRRELAAKEKEEEVPDIDDTDGVDMDAEFEAWKLRELGRIKRDKEAEIRREQEREEVERRRALPEEQRMKEDMEHAQQSRDAKPKGQQKFLQKYWHKGAFRQDEDVLQRHDFTEATESTLDVSSLPKVMQVKNFGKRGRTKYTHLVDQDTSAPANGPGGFGPKQNGQDSGCFTCGGPHLKKDCPQNTGPIHRSGDAGWKNDHGSLSRKEYLRQGDDSRTGDSRRRRSREPYRDDRDFRGYRRSRSRSRSRSPPGYSSRKYDKRGREYSPAREASDKRRRRD